MTEEEIPSGWEKRLSRSTGIFHILLIYHTENKSFMQINLQIFNNY